MSTPRPWGWARNRPADLQLQARLNRMAQAIAKPRLPTLEAGQQTCLGDANTGTADIARPAGSLRLLHAGNRATHRA